LKDPQNNQVSLGKKRAGGTKLSQRAKDQKGRTGENT